VHYDSDDGPHLQAFATLKAAKKGLLKWIEEQGGLNEDNGEKKNSRCYWPEGQGEYMSIVTLDIQE
jgi:hypothetical protein